MGVGSVEVCDEQILEYAGLCARIARRYDGIRGAEFDDLEQEGRIAVWLRLSYGETPVEDDVILRCHSWVKFVSREGQGGFDESLQAS